MALLGDTSTEGDDGLRTCQIAERGSEVSDRFHATCADTEECRHVVESAHSLPDVE